MPRRLIVTRWQIKTLPADELSSPGHSQARKLIIENMNFVHPSKVVNVEGKVGARSRTAAQQFDTPNFPCIVFNTGKNIRLQPIILLLEPWIVGSELSENSSPISIQTKRLRK